MTARGALDVTAIIPTFNRTHYLGECLDALLDQSAPPRQIIVVDDGSTDDMNATRPERLWALLRRAAAMASKVLWRLAGNDIAPATALSERLGITGIASAEAPVLGRVFDEHGYGRDHLDADNPFLREVRALPDHLGRLTNVIGPLAQRRIGMPSGA